MSNPGYNPDQIPIPIEEHSDPDYDSESDDEQQALAYVANNDHDNHHGDEEEVDDEVDDAVNNEQDYPEDNYEQQAHIANQYEEDEEEDIEIQQMVNINHLQEQEINNDITELAIKSKQHLTQEEINVYKKKKILFHQIIKYVNNGTNKNISVLWFPDNMLISKDYIEGFICDIIDDQMILNITKINNMLTIKFPTHNDIAIITQHSEQIIQTFIGDLIDIKKTFNVNNCFGDLELTIKYIDNIIIWIIYMSIAPKFLSFLLSQRDTIDEEMCTRLAFKDAIDSPIKYNLLLLSVANHGIAVELVRLLGKTKYTTLMLEKHNDNLSYIEYSVLYGTINNYIQLGLLDYELLKSAKFFNGYTIFHLIILSPTVQQIAPLPLLSPIYPVIKPYPDDFINLLKYLTFLPDNYGALPIHFTSSDNNDIIKKTYTDFTEHNIFDIIQKFTPEYYEIFIDIIYDLFKNDKLSEETIINNLYTIFNLIIDNKFNQRSKDLATLLFEKNIINDSNFTNSYTKTIDNKSYTLNFCDIIHYLGGFSSFYNNEIMLGIYINYLKKCLELERQLSIFKFDINNKNLQIITSCNESIKNTSLIVKKILELELSQKMKNDIAKEFILELSLNNTSMEVINKDISDSLLELIKIFNNSGFYENTIYNIYFGLFDKDITTEQYREICIKIGYSDSDYELLFDTLKHFPNYYDNSVIYNPEYLTLQTNILTKFAILLEINKENLLKIFTNYNTLFQCNKFFNSQSIKILFEESDLPLDVLFGNTYLSLINTLKNPLILATLNLKGDINKYITENIISIQKIISFEHLHKNNVDNIQIYNNYIGPNYTKLISIFKIDNNILYKTIKIHEIILKEITETKITWQSGLALLKTYGLGNPAYNYPKFIFTNNIIEPNSEYCAYITHLFTIEKVNRTAIWVQLVSFLFENGFIQREIFNGSFTNILKDLMSMKLNILKLYDLNIINTQDLLDKELIYLIMLSGLSIKNLLANQEFIDYVSTIFNEFILNNDNLNKLFATIGTIPIELLDTSLINENILNTKLNDSEDTLFDYYFNSSKCINLITKYKSSPIIEKYIQKIIDNGFFHIICNHITENIIEKVFGSINIFIRILNNNDRLHYFNKCYDIISDYNLCNTILTFDNDKLPLYKFMIINTNTLSLNFESILKKFNDCNILGTYVSTNELYQQIQNRNEISYELTKCLIDSNKLTIDDKIISLYPELIYHSDEFTTITTKLKHIIIEKSIENDNIFNILMNYSKKTQNVLKEILLTYLKTDYKLFTDALEIVDISIDFMKENYELIINIASNNPNVLKNLIFNNFFNDDKLINNFINKLGNYTLSYITDETILEKYLPLYTIADFEKKNYFNDPLLFGFLKSITTAKILLKIHSHKLLNHIIDRFNSNIYSYLINLGILDDIPESEYSKCDNYGKNLLMKVSESNSHDNIVYDIAISKKGEELILHHDTNDNSGIYYLIKHRPSVFKKLLEKKLITINMLNTINRDTETPFMWAIKHNLESANIFIEMNLITKQQLYADYDTGSCLSYAIKYRPELYDSIVDNPIFETDVLQIRDKILYMIDPNSTDNRIDNVLLNIYQIAALYDNNILRKLMKFSSKIVSSLLKEKIKINQSEYNALSIALFNNPESVQILTNSDFCDAKYIIQTKEMLKKGYEDVLNYQPYSWYYISSNPKFLGHYNDHIYDHYYGYNYHTYFTNSNTIKPIMHFIQDKQELAVNEKEKCNICLLFKTKVVYTGCCNTKLCITCSLKERKCPMCRGQTDNKTKILIHS
jgi:hypothetical protein